MARTFASVNEAWRELRSARNRAREENDHEHPARHGYDPNQPHVSKGQPDGGNGPIPEEAKAPPRSCQMQRRTTSGARARSTLKRADAALSRSGLVTDGSRRRAGK